MRGHSITVHHVDALGGYVECSSATCWPLGVIPVLPEFMISYSLDDGPADCFKNKQSMPAMAFVTWLQQLLCRLLAVSLHCWL